MANISARKAEQSEHVSWQLSASSSHSSANQLAYCQKPSLNSLLHGSVYFFPLQSYLKFSLSFAEMVSHKSWNSLKILMVFEMILQPSHRGRGRRGGQIFRGAGRGRRGQAPQPPAPVWPPRMAWCELCRVECNTPEILEQHKNGKKHKKNVKVQEELQRVMAAGHNVQPTSSQVQAEVAYQPKATEGSEVPPEGNLSIETVNGRSEQQPQENLPSQALGEENKAEPELPKAESTRDPGESQGRGPKRKTSGGPGGRGGKKLRSHDGRRKPAEPPKPKQIPLICELCNVTCESQVVFQSHLQGKKHISNRKRFEDSQAVLGQAATQALYPALQPVYPALPQPNPGLATPLDPNLQQQNIPGGQAFLTQPAPSLLPQGQEASAAALPPPMLQSLDHQDPSPQFQSQ
ncbi:PREDICTED: uncharacterized protein LOC109156114 isoform X2 [Ipomoea nil]|uniref:uncharacterized protein LOC109156114 isoform X2 n=2 Tax=Ipomoea nil TaxID=35883 RepID=UPI000901A79A|nr:PREDICTED: uncharacterized protein LOC109156114 isoform X2 [Ipomoea nil]